MPSFPYVKKGDAFQPNLELDNAVRRMVNAQNGFVAGKFSSKGNYGRISVCNVSSEVIDAGAAVSFPATADATDGVIPCEKAKSATAQFGVITSDIAPDSIGSCIVSGPVTVEISGTGDFAAPAEGGKMVAGGSGAPILFRFENTAVINLGGGSGAAGASEYNGPFKLRMLSENQVEVVYGPNPSVDYCGSTDVPECSMIPKTIINVTAEKFNIYLYFEFNQSTKKYSHNFGYQVPKDVILYKLIGSYNKGSIYQEYADSYRMTFGNDFYMPVGDL